MNDFNAKEIIKSFESMKKQTTNLLNNLLNPEIMSKLTSEQLAQVKKAKGDIKALSRKGLNENSEIFKNLK